MTVSVVDVLYPECLTEERKSWIPLVCGVDFGLMAVALPTFPARMRHQPTCRSRPVCGLYFQAAAANATPLKGLHRMDAGI
jgi:hypothetical protein